VLGLGAFFASVGVLAAGVLLAPDPVPVPVPVYKMMNATAGG
jgi:hypothetical protein